MGIWRRKCGCWVERCVLPRRSWARCCRAKYLHVAHVLAPATCSAARAQALLCVRPGSARHCPLLTGAACSQLEEVTAKLALTEASAEAARHSTQR